MPTQLELDLSPTRSIRKHLRRTYDGTIEATFQISGIPYGYAPQEKKKNALQSHRELFKTVPNGSVISAPVALMNPDEIAARAIDAVPNIYANPRWEQECSGKHRYFESEKPATDRLFLLTMPVFKPDSISGTGLSLAGIGGRSAERDQADFSRAAAQAASLAVKIPGIFAPRPLTEHQMVWMWQRSLSRGSKIADNGDEQLDHFPFSVPSNVSPGPGAFRAADFDEGQRRENGKARWRPDSFMRAVRITQPNNPGAGESWQSLVVVETLPTEGLQFPGSEFFSLADQLTRTEQGPGFHVDWAVRISKTTKNQAAARNTRNLGRLQEQIDERDSEVSFAQGTLGEHVQQLVEYNGLLENRDDEFEVHLCPIFAVAAATKSECERGVLELERKFEKANITVATPLGGQRELWAAMNPGCGPVAAVKAYAQVTISEYAAASVPCQSATLGDPTGPIIARSLTGNRGQPVHLDLRREAEKDSSASIAVAGELGGGKSYFLKTLLSHYFDLGAQFMAIDRTNVGEYAHFANALPGSIVVDLMRPKVSMDPLRIFPADIGADKALDLLLPLFGCTSDDPMARRLSKLLRPDNHIESLPGLLRFLQDKEQNNDLLRGEDELLQHLEYWSDRSYSAALFDTNLEPLPLDAGAIVVRTHQLEVPTTEEVTQEGLALRLTPTKKFGRAMYGLSAAVAKMAFFSNTARFGMFVLDEAYHLTSTIEGLSTATAFIKDGRRHNSALALGSHSPRTDYPRGSGLDLIKTRLVFRHTDKTLAEESLDWLGIDPAANEHIVRDLMEHTSARAVRKGLATAGQQDDEDYVPLEHRGQAYMRDARGSIGRIQVIGPSSPARQEAINTTPKAA